MWRGRSEAHSLPKVKHDKRSNGRIILFALASFALGNWIAPCIAVKRAGIVDDIGGVCVVIRQSIRILARSCEAGAGRNHFCWYAETQVYLRIKSDGRWCRNADRENKGNSWLCLILPIRHEWRRSKWSRTAQHIQIAHRHCVVPICRYATDFGSRYLAKTGEKES